MQGIGTGRQHFVGANIKNESPLRRHARSTKYHRSLVGMTGIFSVQNVIIDYHML